MSRVKTTEQFVEEAKEVWGDRWDYSEVTYLNVATKVTIICPLHRERFQQLPNNHRRKQVGCTLCNPRKRSTEEWVQKARNLFGDRWDYSSVRYTNAMSEVTIVCPNHGAFKQLPWNHLRGHVGCNECSGHRVGTEKFRTRSKERYGSRWDLSKSVYTSSQAEVTITCREHGDFSQVAQVHTKGHVGCKPCQSTGFSAGERELGDFIGSLGMDYIPNCRGKISPLKSELDIYIPSKETAIEFNGLYYHSEKFKTLRAHADKFKACALEGIKLLQVWEDDWTLKRPIVEEHIRQALGVSNLPKVPARKTEVVSFSIDEARRFLNDYHIQGFVGASHYLGLRYSGNLVALACFKKKGSAYELVRYATSANVQGGHSKLVAHFEKSNIYSHLITFADLTFGNGALYRKTGWLEDKHTRPDYFYVRGNTRYHKFNYRLKRFREDPNLKFVEGMSERQLAELNGLLRVYDAGKIRFVKPHPNP